MSTASKNFYKQSIDCPHCGEWCVSRVFNTRPVGNSIYRRRKCMNCGKRFTTYEIDANTFKELSKNLDILSRIQNIIKRRKA